jgi:hypothetical protein
VLRVIGTEFAGVAAKSRKSGRTIRTASTDEANSDKISQDMIDHLEPMMLSEDCVLDKTLVVFPLHNNASLVVAPTEMT